MSYHELADVAARMKLRDVAAFAQVKRQVAAIDAKLALISETLRRETLSAEPGDVTSAHALQLFASGAAKRSDKLLAEKRSLMPQLEAARRKAVQSSGRAEAIAILHEQERKEAAAKRQRQEERLSAR